MAGEMIELNDLDDLESLGEDGSEQETKKEYDLERIQSNGSDSVTMKFTNSGISKGRRLSSIVFSIEEINKEEPEKSTGKMIEEEWSIDHVKLLYLMSFYAKAASTKDENETWIRQTPLLVIIYEAVVAGILDYDYAPKSTLVTLGNVSKRVWMNISQEGKAALDDLREKELINGLKLSTEDFQPITALQVSVKGSKILSLVPKNTVEDIKKLLFSPAGDLLYVALVDANDTPDKESEKSATKSEISAAEDEELVFELADAKRTFIRISEVTDTEDVSYVSSPFLPECVMSQFSQPMTDYSSRRHESAAGESTIKDELSEAIILGEVRVLIGEWIPFGTNLIVALNERLGSLDRCQGGLFTALTDRAPTESSFNVSPGLTQVKIIDYDFIKYINFEAEINFPEENGIVQVESFGMHLNVDGTIMYGMKIEAILDRTSESISLDNLARLLVDVQCDSSSIMNDLLSQFQRQLIDMVYMGEAMNRSKYNVILADQMDPFLTSEEAMDRGEYENELKQVLGDIHFAYELEGKAVLIIGNDGLLFAGEFDERHEEIIKCFLSLYAREVFVRNFFIRTFIMDDMLKKTRQLTINYRTDPQIIDKIREKLNEGSRDIILLEEVLEYLSDSLKNFKTPESPSLEDDPVGYHLFEHLKDDICLRIRDLEKLLDGLSNELSNLGQMKERINKTLLENVFKNVETNTKYLVDASAAAERSSASLEVMQVILAGGFAFDILDRVSGGTLNITVPDWVNIFLVDPIISVPFLWFAINIIFLLGVSKALLWFMHFLQDKALGALTFKAKVNKKISVANLEAFLKGRFVEVTDSNIDKEREEIRKTSWTEIKSERWKGEAPKVEIQFDPVNEFLLIITLSVNLRRTKLASGEVLEAFNALLKEEGVYK